MPKGYFLCKPSSGFSFHRRRRCLCLIASYAFLVMQVFHVVSASAAPFSTTRATSSFATTTRRAIRQFTARSHIVAFAHARTNPLKVCEPMAHRRSCGHLTKLQSHKSRHHSCARYQSSVFGRRFQLANGIMPVASRPCARKLAACFSSKSDDDGSATACDDHGNRDDSSGTQMNDFTGVGKKKKYVTSRGYKVDLTWKAGDETIGDDDDFMEELDGDLDFYLDDDDDDDVFYVSGLDDSSVDASKMNSQASRGASSALTDQDLSSMGGTDMEARIAAAGKEARTGKVNVPSWLLDDAAMDESRSGGGSAALGSMRQQLRRSDSYELSVVAGCCVGCGATFQTKDEGSPGYLPPHVLERHVSSQQQGEGGGGGGVEGGQNERRVKDDDDEEEEELEGKKEPEDKQAETICQRCHRLRHQGLSADDNMLRPGWSGHDSLSPRFFEDLLREKVTSQRSVVVTIVDVFDFHGSVLPDISGIVGAGNPLLVAVNKVDLLPPDYSAERVKQWVLRECRDFCGLHRLKLSDVHLISARTGMGVGGLVDDARRLAKQRGCGVAVVGAANVGKSSLLNRIGGREGGDGGASSRKKQARKQQKQQNKKKQQQRGDEEEYGASAEMEVRKPARRAGITTSPLPGTTLDTVTLHIGGGVSLLDTPGLILPHQLTTRLTPEELKVATPSKKLSSVVTLRVSEGRAVLLGGLARVEMVEGRPFFFTFFVAPGIAVHATSATGEAADEFVRKHVGRRVTSPPSSSAATATTSSSPEPASTALLSPPFDAARLDEIGALIPHNVLVEGNGWNEAGCDVALSGLGWFSVTGVGQCKIRVHAPMGTMVSL